MNQIPFVGADPMDTIGNMLGRMIGPELDRIGSQMVCTSANYMSLAAANEEIPIPQVPLGPSLDWSAMFGGLDIGGLLGGLTGGFGGPSRPMDSWPTEGSYWATEGSYWATEGSYSVTEGSYWATEGSYSATEGSYSATEGTYSSTEGSYLASENSYWATEDSYWANYCSYWPNYCSYWATEDSYEYGGRQWRTNGDKFNFTFTPAMLDFRKQILERAFGPDMFGPGMTGPDMFGQDMTGPNMQQFKNKMLEPLVPKLMCAISEGTRRCECSNEYDFEDEGIAFCF